jgi:hypothetical protein
VHIVLIDFYLMESSAVSSLTSLSSGIVSSVGLAVSELKYSSKISPIKIDHVQLKNNIKPYQTLQIKGDATLLRAVKEIQ